MYLIKTKINQLYYYYYLNYCLFIVFKNQNLRHFQISNQNKKELSELLNNCNLIGIFFSSSNK